MLFRRIQIVSIQHSDHHWIKQFNFVYFLFQINFSAFHSTYEVDTPLCSSYELDQYYKARDKLQRTLNNSSAPNTLPSQAKNHRGPSTVISPLSQLPPPLPRSLPPPIQKVLPFNKLFTILLGQKISLLSRGDQIYNICHQFLQYFILYQL